MKSTNSHFKQPSLFKQKVLALIKAVPIGTVASYGQIAVYTGIPRAARQVGWILNQSEGNADLPWWRIINNAGRISIKGCEYNTPDLQRELLRTEGIIVSDEYKVDMEVYRYKPNLQTLAGYALSDEYIEMIVTKYNL